MYLFHDIINCFHTCFCFLFIFIFLFIVFICCFRLGHCVLIVFNDACSALQAAMSRVFKCAIEITPRVIISPLLMPHLLGIKSVPTARFFSYYCDLLKKESSTFFLKYSSGMRSHFRTLSSCTDGTGWRFSAALSHTRQHGSKHITICVLRSVFCRSDFYPFLWFS